MGDNNYEYCYQFIILEGYELAFISPDLAILAGCLPLIVYFIAVPCILYRLDFKYNRRRIDALATWPSFKKKHFGKY
jgi:hypothetical protein